MREENEKGFYYDEEMRAILRTLLTGALKTASRMHREGLRSDPYCEECKLAGKGEQSGLLSDLEDQMAEASKPAKESKRAKKKKDKKPIGELSCEVCMRAVDNIYADVHELAQAWAEAHGATPGGEDADEEL